MSRKVADVLWEMLVSAGVKRCYGIVGDALNPVMTLSGATGKSSLSTFATKNTAFSPLLPTLILRVTRS
jgi:hypothetical protein